MNLDVVKDIRNIFYRHVLMLPINFFDRSKSGKTMSLIINDIQQINNSMTESLSSLFIEPLRLIFFISLLLIINIKLTLMVFIIYPVLGFIIIKIGKSIRRRVKRELASFSGMISVISETILGIRAVKMFNMNNAESKKFKTENQNYVNKALRSYRIHILLNPLNETLAIFVTAILLWYGGKEALSGTSSFTSEDFFRFLFILFSSYQPMKALAGVNSSIQGGIAAAERVFDVLDISTERLSRLKKENIPAFNNNIEVKNLTFSYPGSTDQVLKNISFTINKGQIVAIVGSSGAGKSTILDLLPRFYEFKDGSICIDGKDIREFDLVGLRHLFGIVSQETILFNETVKNNIAYGVNECTVEEIKNAAIAANAMEFIENLEHGMEAVIGERGVTLSGGQRQRLSIARALLRNSPILILDEATSSLDTEAERLVQKAINNLIQNRTVLVVAHRLSTILHADKIIVLEQGKIIEYGTHEELLKLGKKYKYFYDLQFY
jgi:subfamily B ATP-binding cassette protein MsbA